MSESDDKKKARERKVLEDALRLARSMGGEARRNVDRLTGEIGTPRERPDLAIRTACGRIVGIEHFRIDQLVMHDKHAQSAAARFVNDNESQRKKAVDNTLDDELTDEMIELFGNMASRGIQLLKNACLLDLARSLNARLFGLKGHAGKLEAYRCNLMGCSDGVGVELGYLVEIHADFSGLFYFDGRKTRQLHVGELPMFAELYDPLDKASRDVDWIVLAFCGAVTDEVLSGAVIDCRNGKFRKSLERQDLRKTEYLGLGKNDPKTRQRSPGKVTYAEDGESIRYSIENTSGDTDIAELWDNALRDGVRALALGKAGRAFTATIPVQMVYEVLRDRAVALGASVLPGDVSGLMARMSPSELMAQAERFCMRWGIRKPDPIADAGISAKEDAPHD